MRRIIFCIIVVMLVFLSGCTEEARNKFFRSADNILGKDFVVTYISEGKIMKIWKVVDSKITTGKDDTGAFLGYYYFWAEDIGYVQVPIRGTIIEEYRNQKEIDQLIEKYRFYKSE